MKSFAIRLLKAAALWLVLIIGQIAGGALFLQSMPAFANDGPLDVNQAVLVVNGLVAAILAMLAGALRPRGSRLGLLLATVLFGVGSLQALIEVVVFNSSIHMPMALLLDSGAASLVSAVLAGVAIALLWRGKGESAGPRLHGLTWKFPVIAVIYVGCYFLAGAEIAWRSAAVRAFYADVGLTNPLSLHAIPLDAIQFGRGLIWCGLALLLARNLSGPASRKAVLTGLALSLFMAPWLLFPNPFMPWPVRAAHIVETGSSNFIFGAIAGLILLAGARRAAAQASPAASAA